MHRPIRGSIWFSIILVVAFAAGYLVWARANQAWPYDNQTIPPLKHQPTKTMK